jgi:hypothetical protein
MPRIHRFVMQDLMKWDETDKFYDQLNPAVLTTSELDSIFEFYEERFRIVAMQERDRLVAVMQSIVCIPRTVYIPLRRKILFF